jgi:transposase
MNQTALKLPNFSAFDKLFYGLDLAKKDSQLAILAPNGDELANLRFPSTKDNFLKLAKSLRQTDTVALEVSTSANAVMSVFKLHSPADSLLSNPLQTKVISQTRCKTDKVDARVLADLARVEYLPTVWFPDEQTLRLRHFFTDRELSVKHRTQFKNRVHSILHRSLIKYETDSLFTREGLTWLATLLQADELDIYEKDRLHFLLNEIKRQDVLIEDLDATIAAFLESNAGFSHQMRLLVSIPGVSLATGGAILAAIGDISRFSSKQKLASYFGLTPKVKQSGESRHTGSISKQGTAYGRFMAIEAAEHLRKHPVYKRFYEKIKAKKGHNVAKVAVARKLIELVWTLLTRNEEFIYAMPRLTDEKRARIKFLAKKKANLKLNRKETNDILKGTNLRGREIRNEIQKRGNNEAARIADLLDLGKKLEKISPSGFNPRRPNFTEWQKLLEIVAENYAQELRTEKGTEKASKKKGRKSAEI